MRDAVILFTEKYFIAAPSVNEWSLKIIVKDGFCDLVDTVVKFVDVLLVLNWLVRNVKQCSLDIDVVPMGMPHLL